MKNNICGKNSETCSSIPPGECGPDCHGFIKFTPKVRASVEKMSKVLYSADTGIKLDGGANLSITGANVYYKGVGWWLIIGHAQRNQDAIELIETLRRLP